MGTEELRPNRLPIAHCFLLDALYTFLHQSHYLQVGISFACVNSKLVGKMQLTLLDANKNKVLCRPTSAGCWCVPAPAADVSHTRARVSVAKWMTITTSGPIPVSRARGSTLSLMDKLCFSCNAFHSLRQPSSKWATESVFDVIHRPISFPWLRPKPL